MRCTLSPTHLSTEALALIEYDRVALRPMVMVSVEVPKERVMVVEDRHRILSAAEEDEFLHGPGCAGGQSLGVISLAR